MTRLRGLCTATAAVTLFLLSACAQPIVDGAAGALPSGSAVPPAIPGDEDALVLRVAHTGGFVGSDATTSRIPPISVYADGRVIFEGPVVLSYPGPALPNIQVQVISPTAVQQLIDKAVAAGVKEGADFGQPGVADATTTEVTVLAADGKRTVAAAALSEARADDPQLTPAQQEARKKLRAFTDELTNLSVQTTTGKPQPYQPEILAGVVTPYVEPGDDLPARPQPKDWPGSALPGEPLSTTLKLSCVTATGDEADAILAAAKDANASTPWMSGGNGWNVRFRPLLPDETGCADLKAAR